MTFENCAECAGVAADLIQALVVAILVGVPFCVFRVVRSRRQNWCRLLLSGYGSK